MGIRAMWVGAALIAACGGSTLSRPDEQAMPSAGRGPQPEPAVTAGGPAVGSGGSGASGSGGGKVGTAGSASLAGEGGVRQEPMPIGEAGYSGSTGYCGGCSVEYSVRCSWDSFDTGQGGLYPGMDGFCEAVAQVLGAAGEASQGGASASGASQGGASPGSGGACADYVAPPRLVDDDIGEGCISYRDERLRSTCTIREECCVVVEIIDCGV